MASAAGVQVPDATAAGTHVSGVAFSGVQSFAASVASTQISGVAGSGSHFSRALAATIADIDVNAIAVKRRCGVGVIVRLAEVCALPLVIIEVSAVIDSAHAAVASPGRTRTTPAEAVVAHVAVALPGRTRSTLAAAVAAAVVAAPAVTKRAVSAAVVSVAVTCAATILASPTA